MFRIGRGTLVVAALAALLTAPATQAREHGPSLSADGVIVEWVPGASPAERRAAREGADVEFARDLGSRRFQLVETGPGQTPRAALRELEADPAVARAERDAYERVDALPNDPLFGQLWGLRNVGLGINGFSGAIAGADIGAVSAWERTLGTPATVVAVIDTGYRFEHPDLADVAWTNPGETANGLDDDGNGIVDDLHGADFVGADAGAPVVDGDPTDEDTYEGGHGVHTAGTIGAEGNNGIGITGVAQNIRLMPLRACGWSPAEEESACLISAQINAINYAGAKGARAANISLGGTTNSAIRANAIAANPQTLYVVSAGNEASDNDAVPRYPCNHNPVAEGRGLVDNLICVAATDQADQLAGFSDWGKQSVDLGAPGTETLSTYPVSRPVDQDFELNDFAAKWTPSGADGGFGRTNESPLSSYGISDSPGAAPVAGSVRGSSFELALPAGFGNCRLELDRTIRRSAGAFFWIKVELDDEWITGLATSTSGHFSYPFHAALSGGGALRISFEFEAGPSPAASDGVWIDDVALRCLARVGEPGGYAFLQGTSMATPHVTGAAGLLFSLRPGASAAEVRQALLASVDPLSSLAAKTSSGGRLDVAAAADLLDSVAPPAPVLSSTKPASPSSNEEPKLVGSAQRGTRVELFANADCSGTAVASGSAARLAGPGIAVPVASDAVTQISVRATDLAPLDSPCSAPLAYTHKSPTQPQPPENPGPGPTPPGDSGSGQVPPPEERAPAAPCVVPRLAGKTLAGAKAALRAAGCGVGTVRKPRPRQGRRLPPLVVKSSTPGAGARRPAGGKVSLTLGPKPARR